MADNKKNAEQFGSNSNTPSVTAQGNALPQSKTPTTAATPASESKSNPEETVYVPISKPTQKKTGSTESVKLASGALDKRVSLTVAPKTFSRDESLFIDRVKYVLGSDYFTSKDTSWLLSGSKFYGLLYNSLGSTSGLIFPYTPNITISHKVNYDTTEIMHSNIGYNYYKNTPCPTVTISKAQFTADNQRNALHMLSAIWFLAACTKCEFGEANPISKRVPVGEKGLPPPVLYLNGYNSTMDNIPVVISSFNYDLPSELHYVNLVLDMSKPSTDAGFCKMYTTEQTTYYENTRTDGLFKKSDILKKVCPITPIDTKTVKYNTSTTKNGINLSFWLPTELTLSLNLLIQPNFIKTRKQWNLDRYKTGLMLTDKWKNPDMSYDKVQVSEMCNTTVKNKLLSSIPSGWTW